MVGGSLYQPSNATYSTTDGGRSVVTASGTAAGLTVSRKVTVPNAGSEDFARTVDTFTNPTGSPITTTVTIVGNLGSDANTTVFATSDGTGVVSPNDLWIGTDDAGDGTGTPAVIHYIRGPGALKPASVAVVGDNIYLDIQSHGPGRANRAAGLFHHCGHNPRGGRGRGQRPGDAFRLRRPGGRVPHPDRTAIPGELRQHQPRAGVDARFAVDGQHG